LNTRSEFDRLVNEAWNHEFSGWDFSFISNRMQESQPSWDYRRLVMSKFSHVNTLLDQDTGGGELLSSLQPFPPITIATEGYLPNLPIARARLQPLGVQVYEASAASGYPFEENYFDLVINRHGGFRAAELYRILKPGRIFITQQVGGKNFIHLNEILQEQVYFQYSYWILEVAVKQLQDGGFLIIDQCEEYPPVEFYDIGAVVYYLKAVSWQISDFSIEKYANKLLKIHNLIEETGKFKVNAHRFYIEAVKD
jgi:SAM-dependent methyltransferase